MFRDNTAWQAEGRKEVAQHLPGSPRDEEFRASHIRSLVAVQPIHMYICMYIWILFFSWKCNLFGSF